jgi:hypothetical protein
MKIPRGMGSLFDKGEKNKREKFDRFLSYYYGTETFEPGTYWRGLGSGCMPAPSSSLVNVPNIAPLGAFLPQYRAPLVPFYAISRHFGAIPPKIAPLWYNFTHNAPLLLPIYSTSHCSVQ